MTIRPETLARLDTDLLINRLRDRDPCCSITRRELIRRGEGRALFNLVKHEQEDRLLEALPSEHLAFEAHRMDLDAGGVGLA